MRNWLLFAVVAVVALIGLILRFRAAELLPIDYDEDDYLKAGQRYASLLRASDWDAIVNYEYNLEHPPLVKLLYGVGFLALPEYQEIEGKPTSAPPASELPGPLLARGRQISAVFGSLEVLFLSILNPLAGLFLAVHSFTIKYTSQLMLEGFPSLTSLLLIITFTRSKGKFNAWFFLSALFLGLTAASKYLYAVTGIAIIIHWLTQKSDLSWRTMLRKRIALIFLWGTLAVVFFFIFNPFLWHDTFSHLGQSLSYNITYSQSSEVARVNSPWWQHLSYLFTSVPWHREVFAIRIDIVITIFAIFGFKRQWQRNRLIVIWFVVSLLFLFIWETKWPQYILILTAPLCILAAQGFAAVVVDPIRARIKKSGLVEIKKMAHARSPSNQIRKAAPWLLPGVLTLLVIGVFPLLFQAAMSLTDFQSSAIKDGLSGGIWREFWLGLTGQVRTVPAQNAFNAYGTRVHFAGISILAALFGGYLSDILAFELVWTICAVSSQLLLGVGLAILLRKRSVWLRGLWRTIFIIPWVIPEFVAALIWSQIMDPRFGTISLLNATWSQTPGYLRPETMLTWQDLPNRAFAVLLISALWYGFPLMFLAATAGLKSISDDVTEAALLDGANRWQLFRFITWPLLLPFLIPVIILRAIFAFNQFYLFVILRPPDPLSTLASISYHVFSNGGLYAVSAAINMLSVIVLIIFIFTLYRWSGTSEGASLA